LILATLTNSSWAVTITSGSIVIRVDPSSVFALTFIVITSTSASVTSSSKLTKAALTVPAALSITGDSTGTGNAPFTNWGSEIVIKDLSK